MLALGAVRRILGRSDGERRLERADLPFTAGMVLLDILAPILLMRGLSSAAAANVSLLNNFEIPATAVTALAIFREKVSRRLWLAIGLVTAACMLLSLEGTASLSFSPGSLLVLLACVCWGFENNCTRRLSEKDPLEIVVVKGLCSGTGALLIALLRGERPAGIAAPAAAMLLGFVAYGLSIFFYIRAQRILGAARTSTYYAVAPFLGTALSLILFREAPPLLFWTALPVMALGTYFAATDRPAA